MSTKSSSERMGDAVTRAMRHWKTERADPVPSAPVPPPPPALTVAVCREAGALGTTIARKLGERLGWPVYDRELLEHIAAESGLKTHLLESVDEKRMGWLRSYLEAFSTARPVSESVYLSHLANVLLSLSAHGSCIIVGRGAAQFLPAETTLRVRLVAPLARRVATVQHRFGATREEAARRVEATDRERNHFIRANFHKDPADAANYDLVLNVARFSVDECVGLIEQGLRDLRAHVAAERPVECAVAAGHETP